MKSSKIFVDSDAFIALAREADANHEKSISLLLSLLKTPVDFITSNYVFSETITVISQRQNHEAAIRFIHAMQSPGCHYVLKRVDAIVEELALEIFKQQTSKNTSYVDCTNMAYMRQFHIDTIFSFDQVYKTNGFRTVKDLIQESQQAA